jgi:hypothetical protein
MTGQSVICPSTGPICDCPRLRAERRLGEMMAEQPKAQGTKGQGNPEWLLGGVSSTPPSEAPTLASQGIDKNLAKRQKQIDRASPSVF